MPNKDFYLIDSHCHLADDEIYNDLDNIIEAAMANNVRYFMSIGTNHSNSKKTLEIASGLANVVCSVGTHPCELEGYDENNWSALVSHPKTVAIGEIGLDYYYVKEDDKRKDQARVLESMLSIASDAELPCVFHVRDAFDDFYSIYNDNQPGVLHCFTGSLDETKKGLDRGLYISFSGIVTFKNSESLRDVLRYVPRDRILVETDCPYLAPVPYRGKQNQPAYMKSTAIFMAECLGTSLEDVAMMTNANFFRLFMKARDCFGG